MKNLYLFLIGMVILYGIAIPYHLINFSFREFQAIASVFIATSLLVLIRMMWSKKRVERLKTYGIATAIIMFWVLMIGMIDRFSVFVETIDKLPNVFWFIAIYSVAIVTMLGFIVAMVSIIAVGCCLLNTFLSDENVWIC
jgi:hypothetical protein